LVEEVSPFLNKYGLYRIEAKAVSAALDKQGPEAAQFAARQAIVIVPNVATITKPRAYESFGAVYFASDMMSL